MRMYLPFLLLILPVSAQAFDFSKLQEMADNPEAMQRAAEQMAKDLEQASECANAAGLEKMQAEGRAVHEKIKSLCANGDRKGAERAAMDYSKKLINSSEYRQIKKCSEQLMSYLPAEYMAEAGAKADAANSSGGKVKHICDM